MRTFAIANTGCSSFHWFGHLINQDALLVFPTYREIHAFTRPDFTMLTFSIPEELLSSYFERNGIAYNKFIKPFEQVKYTNKQQLNYLRNLLLLFESIVTNKKIIREDHKFISELQLQILFLTLSILTNNETIHDNTGAGKNTRTFKTLIEYINSSNQEKILSMSELCDVAHVSERTVQNIFKRELSMSPKAYLKAQKIYQIHRLLWKADPINTQISHIASKFGIWHMGQFAADYRKLFGVLPSETLNHNN